MTSSHPLQQGEIARRLGCDYAVFGFSHSVEVTIAVTLAGGVGIFGATRSTPDEIEDALRTIRAAVGRRPFGVNLVLPDGMPEHDDRAAIEAQIPEGHRAFVQSLRTEFGVPPSDKPGLRSRFVRSEEMAAQQMARVLAADVDIVACGIGAPAGLIEAAHARGKTVIALVGSPKHARSALAKGADILVAQGHEAAAHTGRIGTFSLVPQVVDLAGDVPVLAAGGVATGRHINAAFALGAQGVWCGTPWLLTEEYGLDPLLQAKLKAAGSDDTVISRADSGKTLRQVRTAWSEAWARPDAPAPLRMPYQDILVGDLLGAIDTHRVEPLMHYPASQGIAHFNEVSRVADVMRRMVDEAVQGYANVPG
ncbi:NAD(P)H-dependent flavin oxidoreductase [Verticiella sediminum]|nr:nitronate monooxygenase [Verticiella sediminum]